jgi:hypothetical protein
MTAIEELCPRSILLKDGRIERSGATHQVVAHYLASTAAQSVVQIDGQTEREGTGNARITRLELLAADTDTPLAKLMFRQSFRLRIHYHAFRRLSDPRFGFALLSDKAERVFQTETTELNYRIPSIKGEGSFDCMVTAPNVLPGLFYLEAWIIEHVNVTFADHLYRAGRIEIGVDPAQEGQMTYLTEAGRGRVLMDCRWSQTDRSTGATVAR